jgi:cytochrome c-type biogenesis protein CcmH/NrfF
VALALEVALGFAMPPRLGVEAARPMLRWVVPAVTAVVAAVVTVRFVRRRRGNHLFAVFFLFTAVNSLLQMILYLLF